MRHSISGRVPTIRRRGTATVAVVGLVLAGTLTACSSSTAQPAATTSGGSATSSPSGDTTGIPSAAFHDTTGLTPTSVTVGNVSTLAFGLFKGADVGTEAWANYVNSTGGSEFET